VLRCAICKGFCAVCKNICSSGWTRSASAGSNRKADNNDKKDPRGARFQSLQVADRLFIE
jgi:hypothetical protein